MRPGHFMSRITKNMVMKLILTYQRHRTLLTLAFAEYTLETGYKPNRAASRMSLEFCG